MEVIKNISEKMRQKHETRLQHDDDWLKLRLYYTTLASSEHV